jgi:serine/threonine protein kinase/DNA-binding SARP family transcriptional activator
MSLRLTTLGTPSVLLDGEEIPSLPGKPVTFGLLVFLAVEREATRDRLVSIFWPESSQERARHTLSQTLYELRQALGEEWIQSTGNLVQVAGDLWVDCLEFVELAEAGSSADAISLYAGTFLEGVYLAQTHPFEEWVERQRARLGRRHRATADAFIQESRAKGDLENALKSAWKWVELDPLDDGGQQHLIQLLAESGSRSEALAQFERYQALLQEELGLDPLDETVELVEAIRAGSLQAEADEADLQPLADPKTPPEVLETEGAPARAPASTWPTPVRADLPAESAQVQAKDRAELQDRMQAELSPSLDVLRPIGQGSMAEVFLAREPHLKRLVAVKVLSPHLYSDASARMRFEREAQAAARINHPHVCTVYRVGSLSDGTPYLVSPFVKGTSLAQRLKAEGRLSPGEVRRVLREIASALAAAHKLGIIHRDVRPDNVLRADESGRHSLCDFGIAGVLETGDDYEPKITKTGEILGHPAYISPEQMDGRPLTDRADMYSLGVLGHQLLTGHPPPPIEDLDSDRGGKGAGARLEPLGDYLRDTDPELADLVSRCLAIQPAHRPSAADLEKKLAGDRRQTGKLDFDKMVEVNLVKLLFSKRLPQILGAYVAGSWIAVELVSEFETRGHLPTKAFWLTNVTVVFGFLAVSILGWFHGAKGRQEMPRAEKGLLGIVAVGWVVAFLITFFTV